MVSFDVKALFTSVPIQPAITIIKKLLEEDQSLQQRTTMSVNNITCLLEFCLKSTYFTYQGQHYQQLEGAAMGSPLSPIVANLFMEDFEQKSHKYSSTPTLLLEKDMWMTPLPSWSHPIEEPSWTTSTLLTSISSLPVKNKEKMGPYHSWMC